MDNQQLQTKQSGKRILLVEDDTFVRELYEYVLKQNGYVVIPALDGEQGLTEAQNKPDLILLDIMLPKLHGMDVLKRLKASDVTKHIPTVLLTNLGQEEVIKDAFSSGANGYLMKMRVDPYKLVDIIKQFLDNPEYVMDYTTIQFD